MEIHDDEIYLKHILESISRLERYVIEMNFKEFEMDEKTVRAVLYDLAIIGEAARKISEKFRAKHPEVPWKKIWDMRNVLVHDYTGVEYPTVWKTLKEDIPVLKDMVSSLITDH
jgi:uncharacterized protein with HEPN domain